MSRSRIRTVLSATALAALVGGAALVAAPPASATDSTWTLDQNSSQRVCVNPAGTGGTYYLVIVEGDWTSTIDYGITGLPAGASTDGGVIAPGSNHQRPDGSTYVNGFAFFTYSNVPAGTYHPVIYATDGSQTQSYPVTLEVTSSCP